MKRISIVLALLGLMAILPTRGFADPIQASGTDASATYIENNDGIIINFAITANGGDAGTLQFASDGEGGFDPFHAGYDTSDGANLPFNAPAGLPASAWTPDPAFGFAFQFWTQLPDSTIWVLPASTIFGTENEPSHEPIAKWDLPGYIWTNPGFTYNVFDISGHWSDTIHFDNSGAGGVAAITFASDPVPEPSSIVLLGLGGIGLAIGAYRRRRATV